MSQLIDKQLDRFLSLLLDHPMHFISGEKCAQELGVTRQSIHDWVHALQGHGLKIEAAPHFGYRLLQLPDLLLPQLLGPQLHTQIIGRKLHHYFQTSSTNDVALEMGREGKTEGTVIIAEEQTKGRGRLGRSWQSERGTGVYLSILLCPPIPPRQAPLLSLVTAIAACQAIEEVSPLKPDIKWPNDILVGGKKCGGILVEMNSDLDRIRQLVIGIGINVNQTTFPALLEDKAGSLLMQAGVPISRLQLTVHFLHALDRFYRLLLAGGTPAIIAGWSQRSSFASGKTVRVEVSGKQLTGITQGLSPEGSLRIQCEDHSILEVTSGEILGWV
jgi:BirA family transcriptional regulator, biotin operon repressor / biotin---[acetyl-CoA-carboxylase] ligase